MIRNWHYLIGLAVFSAFRQLIAVYRSESYPILQRSAVYGLDQLST